MRKAGGGNALRLARIGPTWADGKQYIYPTLERNEVPDAFLKTASLECSAMATRVSPQTLIQKLEFHENAAYFIVIPHQKSLTEMRDPLMCFALAGMDTRQTPSADLGGGCPQNRGEIADNAIN